MVELTERERMMLAALALIGAKVERLERAFMQLHDRQPLTDEHEMRSELYETNALYSSDSIDVRIDTLLKEFERDWLIAVAEGSE